MVNKSGKLKRMTLTAGLALLIVELSRIGLADFMRLEPAAYLDSIRAANALPSHARLMEARERLQAAGTLDPDNPVIPEYLGQIAFYNAMLVLSDAQLQREYFFAALQNYEAALTLRPNSGYLWASMMLTRQALLDVAQRTSAATGHAAPAREHGLDGVVNAMRHAAQLAPWEPGIIQQIVWVGTMHYHELSAQDRAIVDSASARAGKLGLKPISA